MLNDISVIDLLNYIFRRIRQLLSISIIAGLIIGTLKFVLVKRNAAAVEGMINEAQYEMGQKQSDYERYLVYTENLPVSLIDSISTFSSSVTYEVSSVNNDEGYRDDIASFIDSVVSAWLTADISVAAKEVYPETVDDTALRDVVQVTADSETILRLTVKAEDESKSISVAEKYADYLSELIAKEVRNTSNTLSIERSDISTKCSYDKDIYGAQTVVKNNLKELKIAYQDAVDTYEVLLTKNDSLRQALKWGILGFLTAASLYICFLVNTACVFEPVLSAEHISRKTELICAGDIHNSHLSQRNEHGILNSVSPVSASGKELFILEYIIKQFPNSDLLLVCFNDEAQSFLSSMITRNNYDTKRDISICDISRYAVNDEQEADVLLIAELDKTRMGEIEKAIKTAESKNHAIKGFILI